MSDYQTVKEIGRGGFGVVEEIHDASGDAFARKTFSPASYIPGNAHDRLRKRFKRESHIRNKQQKVQSD